MAVYWGPGDDVIQFRRQARFTQDADLNARLVALEQETEAALRALDAAKVDRYVVQSATSAQAEGHFGDLWLLDTTALAIDFFLPRTTIADVGRRVAVVVLSAGHAVTVHAVGTKVNGVATHTPGSKVLVEYVSVGTEWWTE